MLAPFANSAALPINDLSFTLVAVLRAEGHLCNVLTHIASGDWRAVEHAIVSILTPHASSKKLSTVARNILELACDNRGVTGRIMGPFFFNSIVRIAGRSEGKRLEKKIRRLRRRMLLDSQARPLVHPRRAGKTSRASDIRPSRLGPAVLRMAAATGGADR